MSIIVFCVIFMLNDNLLVLCYYRYRKMEAASQCIKRDIVFAASMYVT